MAEPGPADWALPPQQIEPDSETYDEAYDESSAASVLTSIASDIRKGREENGRIYPAYGSHEYGCPVDESELDRLDMQHHKYTMLLGDKLYLCPLGDNPQKIIDIGCGTGIWAIDVAEKFPSAEVIGTDIAPVQPTWYVYTRVDSEGDCRSSVWRRPDVFMKGCKREVGVIRIHLATVPNCYFEVDDCELDWQYQKDGFDLIHTRDCYLSVRNWPRFVQQSYEHLKPGGWLELACVWPVPQCDDGTLDKDSGYVELCETFMEIGKSIGADGDAPRKYRDYMIEGGLVDVEEVIFKMPTSEWPKDKRLKQIGALERLNLLEGGEAFLLRGVTKELGRTRAEMEVCLMRMRKELMANKFHSYIPFYVVYGKKPERKDSTLE